MKKTKNVDNKVYLMYNSGMLAEPDTVSIINDIIIHEADISQELRKNNLKVVNLHINLEYILEWINNKGHDVILPPIYIQDSKSSTKKPLLIKSGKSFGYDLSGYTSIVDSNGIKWKYEPTSQYKPKKMGRLSSEYNILIEHLKNNPLAEKFIVEGFNNEIKSHKTKNSNNNIIILISFEKTIEYFAEIILNSIINSPEHPTNVLRINSIDYNDSASDIIAVNSIINVLGSHYDNDYGYSLSFDTALEPQQESSASPNNFTDQPNSQRLRPKSTTIINLDLSDVDYYDNMRKNSEETTITIVKYRRLQRRFESISEEVFKAIVKFSKNETITSNRNNRHDTLYYRL